jgi:UDP-N-acetylmuramoylalanine--D-glutamate ligase
MRRAYVIGLGRSGVAAAHLLHREGWKVTATDSGNSEALHLAKQQLEAAGIAVELGYRLQPASSLMEQVVVSPGVPWDLPALAAARAMGIETIGEMELAWRSLHAYPWVGITGTNGKTTTTALIAAIFQTAGLHAPACGNIGYAACDLALDSLYSNSPTCLDGVIAELSSYQIEASDSIAPQIGVWTTFTPDHLSRHKTLENYYAIKASLLTRSQQQILNGDDPYLRKMADHWPEAYWTSTTGRADLLGDRDRGAYLEKGWVMALNQPIVEAAALRMVGAHNQQNLLMAVLSARLAGIEPEAIAKAIAAFPGVPHRLEQICTWQGIDFINDSKATNYDAAQVGLSAVHAPAILIAGGEAKAGDDTSWLQTIHAQAAAVLLIGSAASAFADRLKQSGYPNVEIVETMDRAVVRAAELGQQLGAKVVLLSPACASFDQYQNFEQRGDDFRALCQTQLRSG